MLCHLKLKSFASLKNVFCIILNATTVNNNNAMTHKSDLITCKYQCGECLNHLTGETNLIFLQSEQSHPVKLFLHFH